MTVMSIFNLEVKKSHKKIPNQLMTGDFLLYLNLEETERFELSKGYEPLSVFKTGAFNHSATSPFVHHYSDLK